MGKNTQQKPNLINQINQKADNQIGYHEARELIVRIPFSVNQSWIGKIAKHLHQIGKERFQELVQKARYADDPERYLMRCLANESRIKFMNTTEDSATASNGSFGIIGRRTMYKNELPNSRRLTRENGQ